MLNLIYQKIQVMELELDQGVGMSRSAVACDVVEMGSSNDPDQVWILQLERSLRLWFLRVWPPISVRIRLELYTTFLARFTQRGNTNRYQGNKDIKSIQNLQLEELPIPRSPYRIPRNPHEYS